MKTSYQRDGATGVGVRTFDWPVKPPEVRKLVCLPYAGGTSTAFRGLAEALGPTWDITAIDLPGHGFGAPEPPLASVPALCDVVDDQLDSTRYAGGYLLGYSVGGYVAHRLVSRWESEGRPGPVGLVLCACTPPQYRDQHPVYSEFEDGALFDELVRMGGVPDALREERDTFDLFKHVVRAGFQAYETAPLPERTVKTPVLVVGGAKDAVATQERLRGWSRFCRRMRVEQVDGPHIFLPAQRSALAGCLGAFADELEEEI